jgi:cytochrome c oxidase subunit II
MTVIAVIVGGITVATGLLIEWLPAQAAEQAERTDLLMWFLIAVSAVIFTGVTTVLIYAVWRFRAKPGDESDGPPMHGNTKLEVIWTVLPTLLLMVVAVWAYLVLTENEALADDRVEIQVTAEQFAWSFTYPEQGIASGDLRIPVDRQVRLRMRAKDVIHDLYVPEFRVKQDVVPGITTYLTFNPTKAGTYQIICAELCGVGHGVMRARVIVMPQDDYQRWLETSERRVRVAAGAQDSPADQTTTP